MDLQDKVINAFKYHFNGPPEFLIRAPGRVNIIGEHTDYNDGYVMPMNTAVFTRVAAAPRNDRTVRMHSVLFGETFEFTLDHIGAGGAPVWAEYGKGVAFALQAEGYGLTGADLLIDGEIPLGGGLSSSASLEAVIAPQVIALEDQTVTLTGTVQSQYGQWREMLHKIYEQERTLPSTAAEALSGGND